MNRITIFFLYALGLTILLPVLFPALPLLYFAPFLVLVCYKRRHVSCLYFAFICGLIVDLLSAHTRLGTYALTYCLTIWILYPQKYNFFEDSFSTFPIMTFLFSLLNAFFSMLLINLFDQSTRLSWEWIKNDLILLPVADAIYAAIAFSVPYFFFPKSSKRRVRRRYVWASR